MNRKNILLIAVANVLVIVSVIAYIEFTRTKTYYIDLQKIYGEFELKKELEAKLEAMVSITNEKLDSLEMQAQIINTGLKQNPSDKSKIEEYNRIAEIYSIQSEQFDQQKSEVAEQYDQQIWSQLNEYIRSYGKENNCDFIIAGNGDGSIMYAKESSDITDKMIIYVNNKYQGK